MTRRSFAAVAVALAAIAACGELVGLGDRPTIELGDGGPEGSPSSTVGWAADAAKNSYPACGVATASSECQSCLAASCCMANAACAANAPCSAYEDCIVPCAGDYACRARCLIQYDPVAPEIAAVNACVAESCGEPCGVTCGITDSFAEPDAATGCSQCLGGTSSICTAWQNCETNAECAEVALCAASCTTQDCQSACSYHHDAGAELYLSAVLGSVKCVDACDIGAYWECVGKFEPRTNQAAETVLTLALSAPTASDAVGVHVVACPSTFDHDCSQPVESATTDQNGNVTLHLPVGADEVGFSGYFELSGTSILPQLAFLEFPLSEPVTTLTISLAVPTALQNTYDQVGVHRDPTLGTVWVATTDCHWTPSTGVTLQANGLDGPILVSYGPNAAATTFLGWAFALNSPAGDVTLSVDVPTIGRVVDGISIFTAEGAVSTITLHPNVVRPPTPPGGQIRSPSQPR